MKKSVVAHIYDCCTCEEVSCCSHIDWCTREEVGCGPMPSVAKLSLVIWTCK